MMTKFEDLKKINKNQKIIAAAVGGLFFVNVGLGFYADSVAEKELDAFIDEMNLPITYDSASAGWLSGDLEINGISFDNINVYSLEVTGLDPDLGAVQPELGIKVKGVSIPVSKLDRSLQRTYKDLGYTDDVIFVDAEIDYSYDTESLKFNLEDFTASVHDVGAVSVNFVLSDFDFSSESLGMLMFGYNHLELAEAEFKYEDDDLVDRFWELGAKSRKMSVSETREKFIARMQRSVDTSSPAQVEAFDEFKDFLEGSGNIELSVSPDSPVSIGEMMRSRNPMALIEKLGVEVKG